MRRLALAAVVVALAAAGTAAADGDPASDFLIQQDVFVPYPPPSAASVHALTTAVNAVSANGDRVKVAVIASSQDLGSVPSLFGQPQSYAEFLGKEIAFAYKGPLLVVMPAGIGFAEGGVADDTAVAGAHVTGASPTALTSTAAATVTALERAGALHYRDTHRPTTFVDAGKVAAGAPARLRYQAWDDSGRASVKVVVETAAGRPLATFPVAMRQVRQGSWYGVTWKTPRRGVFAVCATATDPAGNRSKTSCGKLTVA
jgi:hypothetical protein